MCVRIRSIRNSMLPSAVREMLDVSYGIKASLRASAASRWSVSWRAFTKLSKTFGPQCSSSFNSLPTLASRVLSLYIRANAHTNNIIHMSPSASRMTIIKTDYCLNNEQHFNLERRQCSQHTLTIKMLLIGKQAPENRILSWHTLHGNTSTWSPISPCP